MNIASAANARSGSVFARWFEIGAAFLKLGCISFGGPVAHIGYLRTEFVVRRKWVTDDDYGDLVALSQFLPGPTSSQTVFGLGLQRGGLVGALIASSCFTAPSALLMILFAYGVTMLGDLRHAGWLHGLKLAAVAVVAQAVWGMGKKLCPDRTRLTIAVVASGAVLFFATALAQIGVLLGGGLVGWWLYRVEMRASVSKLYTSKLAVRHLWAGATLIIFAALLILLPTVALNSGNRPLQEFDAFYRSGSLVFGGGHVILPLLRAELIPRHWIGDDAFLAGYGAAQALPGPLTTFAAYLGTMIHGQPRAWMGGLWCLFAIFLPAWLLMGGAIPFWQLLRGKTWTQAALRGVNAAVVGVLLAALYNPVWKEAVSNSRDVATVLTAFTLLEMWRLPPWLVVLICAAAGEWLI